METNVLQAVRNFVTPSMELAKVQCVRERKEQFVPLLSHTFVEPLVTLQQSKFVILQMEASVKINIVLKD